MDYKYGSNTKNDTELQSADPYSEKKATNKLNTEQTDMLITYSIKDCIFSSLAIKVFPSNLQSLIIIANHSLLY